MNHVDAGHRLEQLSVDMGYAPGATRRHVELAWIDLGIGNELRNGLGWNRWINQHDERHPNSTRDGHDVADKIETKLVEQRVIDGVRRCDKEKCVAIGWRAHHCLSWPDWLRRQVGSQQ